MLLTLLSIQFRSTADVLLIPRQLNLKRKRVTRKSFAFKTGKLNLIVTLIDLQNKIHPLIIFLNIAVIEKQLLKLQTTENLYNSVIFLVL